MENPWVKDSDFVYQDLPDSDEAATCSSCTAARDDVRDRDGLMLCDLCAIVAGHIDYGSQE